jgi:TetR/AcrR family transcriptional regulator
MARNTSTSSDPDGVSTRERILDVAVEELSRKGFAATRIDVIAQRARVNKQLIYYYFDSKSGLYDAVLDRLVEAYRPMSEALREATVEDMLALRAKYAATEWQRLLAWEGLEYWDNEDRTIHLEEVRTSSYRLQTEVIARAQEAGSFPQGIEPRFASLLLLYSSLGPVALPQITKMVTGLDPTDPELHAGISAALETLIHSFLATTHGPDDSHGATQ